VASGAHSLAHYYLNYNYPPCRDGSTKAGGVLRSIYIGKQVELGGDPELLAEWHETRSMIWECGAIRRYRSR